MTGERNPTRRLDALLAGLEEDILGLDDRTVLGEGQHSLSDPSRVRSLIRSAIDSCPQSHLEKGAPRRRTIVTPTSTPIGQPTGPRVPHTNAPVGRDVTRGAGRLRMAYSGSSENRKENPPPKETSRKRSAKARSSNKKA